MLERRAGSSSHSAPCGAGRAPAGCSAEPAPRWGCAFAFAAAAMAAGVEQASGWSCHAASMTQGVWLGGRACLARPAFLRCSVAGVHAAAFAPGAGCGLWLLSICVTPECCAYVGVDQGQGARRRLAMACSAFMRRPGPNPPSRAAGVGAPPLAVCRARRVRRWCHAHAHLTIYILQKLWYCAITAHAWPVALLSFCPWWLWAMGRPGFKHMRWAPVLVAGLAALAVASHPGLGCSRGSCWVCGARAGSFKPRHTWLIFPGFATL